MAFLRTRRAGGSKRNARLLALELGVALLLLGCPAPEDTGKCAGEFSGPVEAAWLDEDDRKMKLLRDFSYRDSKGVQWMAPEGSIIDGASIPRWLWTVVGSPFTGPYRKASVVHDVACDTKSKPWLDVHRMFYEACLCGGATETQAKVMYAAVYKYGPRWAPGGGTYFMIRSAMTEDQFKMLKSHIETENPSLEAIENFALPSVPHPRATP
jgi:uncharacterized protein DUF1353